MFSHIMIGANDLDRAKSFYDALLGSAGIAPLFPHPSGGRVYGKDGKPFFVVLGPYDKKPATVGGLVDGGFHHFDAAEMGAVIIAQELVVIARQINDAGALAGLPQQLLHDVVVLLRPVPAGLQLPAVDDIADEIDGIGVVVTQEVEKLAGLAAARAEMHIGNKEGTKLFLAFVLERHRIKSRGCFDPDSGLNPFHCRTMTTTVNAATHRPGNRVTALSWRVANRPRDDSADSRRRDFLLGR